MKILLIIVSIALFILLILIGSKKSDKINSLHSANKTSDRVGISDPTVPLSSDPKVNAILKEGNEAISEMGSLYSSIADPAIREKINQIMLITDKIMKDASEDPGNIPQIKRFFSYYLPTTVKLLNSYKKLSSQEITGENIDSSLANIQEMLDVAVSAYQKRLDSLFANQALDIETDIDVMNQLLEREGLTGESAFLTQKGY